MNRAFLNIILLVLAFGIWGCQAGKSPIEYMKSAETSEVLNKHSGGAQMQVSAHYRSSAYLAFRELLKQGVHMDSLNKKDKMFKNEREKFSRGIYFEVRISGKSGTNVLLSGISDQKEYATRVDYLNNSIYRDFYILTDDYKKVRSSGHGFQNSFGAGNSCDLSLVFPVRAEDLNGDVELIYEDRIFGLIPQKRSFSFEGAELKKWSKIN